MKLFTLGINFNLMDWIIGSEAKIRVTIRDHIFSFFSCSSSIPQNPLHPTSIWYQSRIFCFFPSTKIHFKKICSMNSDFTVPWIVIVLFIALFMQSAVRSPFQARSEPDSSSVWSVRCMTESQSYRKDFTAVRYQIWPPQVSIWCWYCSCSRRSAFHAMFAARLESSLSIQTWDKFSAYALNYLHGFLLLRQKYLYWLRWQRSWTEYVCGCPVLLGCLWLLCLWRLRKKSWNFFQLFWSDI